MDELRDAIFKSYDTATGPDDKHYQMLKYLPPNVMTTLYLLLQFCLLYQLRSRSA